MFFIPDFLDLSPIQKLSAQMSFNVASISGISGSCSNQMSDSILYYSGTQPYRKVARK